MENNENTTGNVKTTRSAHLKALAGGRKAPVAVRTKLVKGHLISLIQCPIELEEAIARNLINAGESFSRKLISRSDVQFDLDIFA